MTAKERDGTTSASIWYFLGAVFVFVLPNQLFAGLDWWLRMLFIAVGVAMIVAGFVQLRREMRRP